jgi:hypothetical protein
MATKLNIDDRLIAVLEGIAGELSLARRAIEAQAPKPGATIELGIRKATSDLPPKIDCSYKKLGSDAEVIHSPWRIYHGKGQPYTLLELDDVIDCKLLGVYTFVKETTEGDSPRFCLDVMADRRYVFEAGILSGSRAVPKTHELHNWTGPIAKILATATEEQLRQVWTIGVRQGTEKKTAIFPSLKIGGEWVDCKGEPHMDELDGIIVRVNEILGYTPWTEKDKESEAPDEPPIAPSPVEFISKADCSQLWKDAEALGWTTATFGQLMINYGFLDDKGKGTPRAITVDKLAMIRSMALDRAVLNEYSGVSFSQPVEGIAS